ncbi:uncharacterized protein [Littorina saxatilis]|uniref:uncharacterized protein n=1 Tax=Littorina saxatilis TaxID=31220 RepID=UPI0038B4FAFC
MASYQVVCNVTRPPEPTAVCEVSGFQEKAASHSSAVFQDCGLIADSPQSDADDLLSCALVTKTSASFSGEDNFHSQLKLPFFWCDLCPFETESKASLLLHTVQQHCFVCRYCSFVALSRCAVVRHTLGLHPEFAQQFREQRLRSCQLKRREFQQYFQPESNLPPLPRKQADRGTAHDTSGAGPSNQYESKINSHDVKTDQEAGNSSSSESVEEMPVPFIQQASAGGETLGLSSTSAASQVPVTKFHLTPQVIGENVVSSSGMEPEVEIAGVSESASGALQDITPQTTTLLSSRISEQLQRGSAEQSRVTDAETPTIQGSVSVEVKCEPDTKDRDFAQALVRSSAGFSQGEGRSDEPSNADAESCADDMIVELKQEPEDTFPEEIDSSGLARRSYPRRDIQQVDSRARPTVSPTLSAIQEETLQRQFEESFGMQTSASSASSAGQPHPVRLFTPSQRLSLPQLVENFLLSPSQSERPTVEELLTTKFNPHLSLEVEGSAESFSATSMLRRLLTKPQQNARAGQSVSHGNNVNDVDADLQEVCEDNNQFQAAGRPDGKLWETTAASVSLAPKQPPVENFLLSPQSADGIADLTSSLSVAESITPSGKNSELERPHTFPEETITPFIKQEPVDVEDFYHSSLAASGDELHKHGSVHPRENIQTHTQPASMPAKVPAETLKSYSNMSLRDLLTMKTELDERAVQEVDTYEGGSADEGEVVWECGFCHFSGEDKAVVQAHRQEHHLQQMAEAGFGDNQGDDSRRSSLEDEEDEGSYSGSANQEKASRGWTDEPQPSTSRGFTASAYQYSDVPEVQAGSKRSTAPRLDDDYDYLSEETEASESGTEPEDLSDKNYVPPSSATLGEVLSSEDEDKTGMKTSTARIKRRGRLPGPRKNKAADVVHGQPHATKQNGSRARESETVSVDSEIEHEMLYNCPFCSHPTGSVQELKSHICRSADEKHMLFLHYGAASGSLCYVCPGDRCVDTFPNAQSYLMHVLSCQGHVLDAQECSVQKRSQSALDKLQRVAGFLNCPVSNCYFVSPFKDQMNVHMNSHVQQVQASQMLLFRSVCSVMAKLYATVKGFDRFLCYRCGTILMNMSLVMEHMNTEHGGKVRGMMHTVQLLDQRPRGIMVAVQCLQCSHCVPSLDKWFTHQCPPEDRPGNDHSTSPEHPQSVALYTPKTVTLLFEEWMWRKQTLSIKALTGMRPENKTQGQSGEGDRNRPIGQLPLIRSILLAEPPRTDSNVKGKLAKLVSKRLGKKDTEEDDLGEKETEEDDVTTMLQCDDCQNFVSESEWKQHNCFVDTIKDSECAAAAVPPHSGSPSRTDNSQPPEQASHSMLLSALASLHQTKSASSRAAGSVSASAPPLIPAPSLVHKQKQATGSSRIPALTPAPCLRQASASSSVTHPSLLNLLTKGVGSSGSQPSPGDPGAPSTSQCTVGDLRSSINEGAGMIRSLLMGSASSAKVSFGGVEKQVLPTTSRGQEGLQVSDAASDNFKVRDTSGNISQQPWIAQRQPNNPEKSQTHSSSQDSTDGASSRKKRRTEVAPKAGGSSGPSPAPLMCFLRQQGDQVMQVLGNVWDTQDDVVPQP